MPMPASCRIRREPPSIGPLSAYEMGDFSLYLEKVGLEKRFMKGLQH